MANEKSREHHPVPLLTAAEVAAVFRVSPTTVARWGRSGRPFETVGHGYEWAHVEGLVTSMEAEVADAAHALAQLCLDAEDAEAARWAAQRGLRASQGNEQLYRDQMFAADLAGNLAGVEKIMDELSRMVEDDDPLGGLHPETVAVYKQLTHTPR